MAFVIGLDVGGTFTDCVVVTDQGEMFVDKAFTTPQNTALGMIQAIENASRSMGMPVEQLLPETVTLALGTTTLTNLLITRRGAKAGLLTTKGFEDTTLIGRVLAKTEGLPDNEKLDILAWGKPTPMASRPFIKGVTERVDYKGSVVVPLDEAEVRRVAAELIKQGVETIAVCFLWSFMNSNHERRVKQILNETYPRLFVTLSSEVAPVLGEYERALTTLMNAHLGPAAAREIHGMQEVFAEKGFKRHFLVMQSNGGVIWDEEVPKWPVNILASGPVGGVNESASIGKLLGHSNVIATDMGGTSFDVGIVVGGRPHLVHTAIYDRFRTFVPTVEVVSIGAGGGSIATIDPLTKRLLVGPGSAGSDPGPVCYQRGGTEPTVTDADVVLNRVSPESFHGGRHTLNREAAQKAIEERIAKPLGYDTFRAAKGILDIVDARMADLIRKLTVERGLDPRDFVMFAYGGAGPVHVGAYGREIGLKQAIVSPYAPVFSALGIASSDMARHYSRSEPMQQPFDPGQMTRVFTELEGRARDDLLQSRVEMDQGVTLNRFVDMRFRYQVHEIRVPISAESAEVSSSQGISALVEDFIALYEQTFGQGTALREAGVEVLTFHVVSIVKAKAAALKKYPEGGSDPGHALKGARSVFWDDAFMDTPIFDQGRLAAGNQINGPAVIEAPNTNILIHPEQRARLDPYLNVVIDL